MNKKVYKQIFNYVLLRFLHSKNAETYREQCGLVFKEEDYNSVGAAYFWQLAVLFVGILLGMVSLNRFILAISIALALIAQYFIYYIVALRLYRKYITSVTKERKHEKI